jgi:replicative DNA helicase
MPFPSIGTPPVIETTYNLEAEMAVLGSMLAEKEAMLKAMDMLQVDDFMDGRHKQIYKSIRDLYDRNVPPDVITIGEQLQKDGLLEGIGTQAYLFKLVDLVPSALHVEHYAKIVKEKSVLRSMISIAKEIHLSWKESDENAHALLDKAQQLFFQLAQSNSPRGMLSSANLMQTAVTALEKMAESNKFITGVPTGFKELDKLTSGLQPANMIVIAGRPSMGKTTICLNMAEHVAIKEKMPVVFFSLEMSEQEVGLRLLCSQARINIRNVREGFLARKSWPTITNVASQIAQAPLYFDFSTSPSILDIRASARRWAHELRHKGTPLGMIVIDYLQLLKGPAGIESRQQEIAEISRSIKAMARELNLPVIAIAQLNRRSDDRSRAGDIGRPQLSDLRESGAIEQDADLVAAVFREEVYKRDDPDLRGKAKLFVLKQRNGPVGDVDLNFLSEFTRFADPAGEEEPF